MSGDLWLGQLCNGSLHSRPLGDAFNVGNALRVVGCEKARRAPSLRDAEIATLARPLGSRRNLFGGQARDSDSKARTQAQIIAHERLAAG
jgi:hypothetical protein